MDDLKKKQKKKRDIYCGNCGKFGHTYKKCTEATTSLGIILYKLESNEKNEDNIKFLMIQRKDSIGYVEFIRGRYKINEIDYLKKIFSEMTKDEIDKIKTNSFLKLWEDLWMTDNKKQYKNEYDQSKSKFDELKEGKMVNNLKIDLNYMINLVENFWDETEWGFPKGRRNLKESDINCANREFQEETGYLEGDYVILKNIEPVEEVYVGTNKVTYKHIYYIGKCISDKDIDVKKDNKIQIAEVKNIGWFYKDDALNKLRSYSVKKKEVLEYVYKIINNNNLDKNSLLLYKSPKLKEIIGNNDIDEDIVVI